MPGTTQEKVISCPKVSTRHQLKYLGREPTKIACNNWEAKELEILSTLGLFSF